MAHRKENNITTFWDRVKMNPDELRERFTHSIKKYNKHFKEGDYEVSFLLAQSLFEDRINVLWILCSWFQKSEEYWDVLKPDVKEYQRKGLSTKVMELKDWDIINYGTMLRWKKMIQVRNALIHFSLFNTDEFTLENSRKFYNAFRKADRIINEYKIKTDFYNESK